MNDRCGQDAGEGDREAPRGKRPEPKGEGAGALELAEVYFKQRQNGLRHLRGRAQAGASPSHSVFEALDRLDNLYTWIITTMQEVRWTVLIFEGLKANAERPQRRSFTSSAEWLASLSED